MHILIHTFSPGQKGVLHSLNEELKKRGHILIDTIWKTHHSWETGKENSWTPYFYDIEPLPTNIDCTIVVNPPSLWQHIEFPRPIIYIPHGVQIVSPGMVNNLPNSCPIDPRADISFVSGAVHYEKCLMYNDSTTKYVITGWPKTDELYNADSISIRQSVIEELKLDKNKPIIIYTPTSEIPKHYIDGLGDHALYPYPNSISHLANYVYNELKDDYNIIFCPHELDYWEKYMINLPNVICPQGKNGEVPNKNKYLIASDLLIGDRSSIMHEYLITLKPQIHLWNDLDNDNFKLHIFGNKVLEEVAFGPKISAREIKKYVDMLIHDPLLYLDKRIYWRDRIFANIGCATEKVVNELELFVANWKNAWKR